MSNKGTISETYSNLNKVIQILEEQQVSIILIESMKNAQKYLLTLELMAIASKE